MFWLHNPPSIVFRSLAENQKFLDLLESGEVNLAPLSPVLPTDGLPSTQALNFTPALAFK